MKMARQNGPERRMSRRRLLAAGATVALWPMLAAGQVRRRGIRLGFDNFAVRSMGWNARQLVDHADKLGCDSLFITDFGPFEGMLDDASLADLRRYGEDHGVAIELGTWSICPTAKRFKHDWGTAEEHLALGIRMARAVGSKALRVVLGSHDDRTSEGGIAARITDTVAVLRHARSLAVDSGIRVAVENHAGDMRSEELVGLVEAAGPDFVGVNFDSGNACWTLEDPVRALARLAPFVATTSLRDAMVWESPRGVTVQWTAMGEGCVDLEAFFDLFELRCPGVTVNIETISGFPREFPCFEPDFWQAHAAASAADLAAFWALARRGRQIEPFRKPAGEEGKRAEQAYQLAELERSIAYCKGTLGLGVRG
jgi:sugar phosphate isomerase/epimerase